MRGSKRSRDQAARANQRQAIQVIKQMGMLIRLVPQVAWDVGANSDWRVAEAIHPLGSTRASASLIAGAMAFPDRPSCVMRINPSDLPTTDDPKPSEGWKRIKTSENAEMIAKAARNAVPKKESHSWKTHLRHPRKTYLRGPFTTHGFRTTVRVRNRTTIYI